MAVNVNKQSADWRTDSWRTDTRINILYYCLYWCIGSSYYQCAYDACRWSVELSVSVSSSRASAERSQRLDAVLCVQENLILIYRLNISEPWSAWSLVRQVAVFWVHRLKEIGDGSRPHHQRVRLFAAINACISSLAIGYRRSSHFEECSAGLTSFSAHFQLLWYRICLKIASFWQCSEVLSEDCDLRNVHSTFWNFVINCQCLVSTVYCSRLQFEPTIDVGRCLAIV